jgi:hypothetical protein
MSEGVLGVFAELPDGKCVWHLFFIVRGAGDASSRRDRIAWQDGSSFRMAGWLPIECVILYRVMDQPPENKGVLFMLLITLTFLKACSVF